MNKINIPPEVLNILDAISGQGFIAGGYARWCVAGGSAPSDIDIFHYKQNMEYVPIDQNEFDLSDPVVEALQDAGYRITRDLPNAIEMKMMAAQECTEAEYNSIANAHLKRRIPSEVYLPYYRLVPIAGYLPVQVIKPFINNIPAFNIWSGSTPAGIKCAEYPRRLAMQTFGTPAEVLGLFDFPQAMVALEYIDTTPPSTHMGIVRIVKSPDFDSSEESHRLSINHINCPVAVAMRVVKYVSKGYTIRPRELIKLFKDWDARPPEYKKRLIDLCEKDNLEAAEWFELEQLLRID